MTLWCRMLPWQIWLCFCFVQDEGRGTKLVNNDMGMQSHIEVIQFTGGWVSRGPPRGKGWGGWEGVFVNRSESRVVPSSRHTSWLSLFVLSSVICEPKKVHVSFFKKGTRRGNVPPSFSSESRVEMSQQKDLVLFFLYVFVEWLIRDESSMRSSDRGPKWAQDNYSVKGDVFNPDHEPTFM